MSLVLTLAPLDSVDLLLDFQRFKVVEFRFVRLELDHSQTCRLAAIIPISYCETYLCVELIFASLLLLDHDESIEFS